MFSRRRAGSLRAAAVTGALAVVLAACGGGSGSGGGGSSEGLIVGTTDTVDTVDPAKCYSYFCSNILNNAGNTLVNYKPGTTELQPRLAAEMPKVSEDGTTYTFPIRKGVTFHDGSKMTAKDVKFSLNRARWMDHPEGAGFLLDGIKKITTPDNYTVVIQLKRPDITFTSKLAYTVATILPSNVYKSPDGPRPEGVDPEKFVREKFVGTGPYKVAKFREGQSILLQAYDNYWGQQPKNDKTLVSFYAKSSQLVSALKAGEIDIAFRSVTPQQRESLKNSDQIKVVQGQGATIRYLVLNTLLEPVKDVQVRKAIAAAVDRKRIVNNVLQGAGEPLYSMVPPTFDANTPSFKKLYADKKPSDFIGNKKVDITLWYSTNHYGPTEPELAQSVARSLEETGSFNVSLKSSAWAQFSADAYPGKTGQYQAFLLGWYPDYLDPDDYIKPFYSCNSFLEMYCNDKMEKLITKEQTADSVDSKQRMKTFGKIQDLTADDVPIVPLHVRTPTVFAQSNVQGLKQTMGPEQIFRYYLLSKSGE